MLKISNVETFYGKIQALRGVDIDVNDGEIVSLIGSNGAGKSTLLMTISGVNKARNGNITFNGERIENKAPHKIVDLGICQVPEGRRIFSRLTVEENLRLGAYTNEQGKHYETDIKEVYDLFPSTASCSDPSGPRSASCGPKRATSVEVKTVCSAVPMVMERRDRNKHSANELATESV